MIDTLWQIPVSGSLYQYDNLEWYNYVKWLYKLWIWFIRKLFAVNINIRMQHILIHKMRQFDSWIRDFSFDRKKLSEDAKDKVTDDIWRKVEEEFIMHHIDTHFGSENFLKIYNKCSKFFNSDWIQKIPVKFCKNNNCFIILQNI